MNMPPPGGWPPPQQPGPPPYGESHPQPQFGSQPPSSWQQGNWPQQPTPPPQKQGGSLKWLLIGVAVLLVIAISVGATLLFTRDDRGGASTPTSGGSSDIASANDTGPVSIITDEPTCGALTALNNALASAQANGWADQRADLGPASTWTSDERARVDTVAKAMANAADKAVALARQTPHRLVRELYEQFVYFSRAYARAISSYKPADNYLATASISSSTALVAVCNTIEEGSTSRGLGLPPAPTPTEVAPVGDPANPTAFVSPSDPECQSWVDRLNTFNTQTSPEWQNRDSSIPGAQWTPERRALEDATAPLLTDYANGTEATGIKSRNPQLADFAIGTALYIRAYLSAGNQYTSADGWLNYAAFQIANFVSAACSATSGS